MPRSIPEIITHIRTCVAEPSIHTMLVQTGDLSALCDAADTTLLSQVRQLEAEVGRLKGELSQQIEKTSRALNQVDIEAERAGNFENDKDALEAQVRQKDEALRKLVHHYDLNDCDERTGPYDALEVPISELREAKAALSPTPQPDTEIGAAAWEPKGIRTNSHGETETSSSSRGPFAIATSDQCANPQPDAAPADKWQRLLATAKLLYANAEGCAVNHYAGDFEQQGFPGWLRDCEDDIKAVEGIAPPSPADTVSMPKSTYLYLRGALSMLPEDALGFGNYADPQHGQPAQYPILRELQDRVDQLLPSTASPLPADATAWLIEFSEKVSRTPAYYGHTGEGLGETTDSLKAVRFARREDAQAIIDDIGWNEARPVEHMWADSKCCNDLSPEECAQVPDRHCDGLQPASLLPADVAGMRAFGASEAACYHWPEDTELHRACREAYCRGAADCPPTDAAVKALERIAAVELGEQKETEAHWPARLMQSIAREALAANGVK